MKFKDKIYFCFTFIVLVMMSILLIFYFGFINPATERDRLFEEMREEYFTNKIATYEKENEVYGDYEVDVAFIGDSLTDMYDLKHYFPEIVTANRGISSDTTFGLEERLKVSLYDLKPKVVVMLIGGNNLNTMFDNYENILISLRDNLPDSKVVLMSLTAMSGSWGKNNNLAFKNNIKIKELANKYNYYYVDLFSPLYDFVKQEAYADYTIDGAHFTPLGYEVVTGACKPVIYEALEEWKRG